MKKSFPVVVYVTHGKQELQKKQKTLDIIQQNFSMLLDAPEINSDLLPAKRESVSVTRDK